MLTFECGEGIVEVNLDASGLEDLYRVLERLRPGDHEHLFTPSWGGYPLTEDFANSDLVPVHQVTIQLIDPGSAKG